MLTKMAESFTVTLVSNQNEDVYVSNINHTFSNVLPRHMDLSGYQVALQSIYYTDHFPKKVAVGEALPAKQFFNLENKDNEVIIILMNASQLNAQKQSDVFTEFIDKLNADAA